MNLDKFAADIIEALLKDLGDTFPNIAERFEHCSADLYGWRVARAEALADALKGLATKTRVLDAEFDLPMRDLFAMNAPEVPSWFIYTPAHGHPGEAPLPDLKNPEEEEGYGDLPHHEQWAKRQVYTEAFNRLWKEQVPLREAHAKAMRAWQQADAMGRLTQWRWAYAGAMLRARNPEPQPVTVEAKT